MEKELVVETIKLKLLNELTYEKVCSVHIDEYRKNVVELFDFINIYKDDYSLDCFDFRELLDKVFYNSSCDEDWEVNRLGLIIDELAIYYAKEPYFWNTPFEEYKSKLLTLLSYEK